MASSIASPADPIASTAQTLQSSEVSRPDVEPGASGKGQGGIKGKEIIKVGDITVVSGQEGQDLDVEMADTKGEGAQMGVDTLDIAAHRAIFSLNRINLLKPPLPLKFGNWNSRPLRPNRAKELLDTMKSQETRPYRLQNMIPIIISRGDVDPGCLSMDFQAVSTSPILKLTPTGMTKLGLGIAGGQHRYHAVKLATAEAEGQIAKLKETITTEEAKDPKGEDAKERRRARLQEMRRSIEEKERLLEGICMWGIILYDEGEYIYD
jgi:hypothetical protein